MCCGEKRSALKNEQQATVRQQQPKQPTPPRPQAPASPAGRPVSYVR